MFNRPETVPYFTQSLVLCKNRLLTHCYCLASNYFLQNIQPRSQGLSSSRPRKRERGDPGWGWSRVSQNLGDYK